MQTIELVEVSPRDGLQNEPRILSTEDKVELVRRAVDAGARRLEVASFVHPGIVPQMADAEAVVAALPRGPARYVEVAETGGRLGFITDITLTEMQELVPQMLTGAYEREERTLLEARIVRDGLPIHHALAFNDVVVNRSGFSGMAELRVSVDGRFMYNQRSDGLIVATPTGSTAYALSSAGPILHPQLQGFVLVPIAPHSLSNRPIALPDSCTIDITVTGGRDVSANFDMQSFAALKLGDRIAIERAPMTIRFLHPVGYSHFATLRQKLHWNEPPVAVDGKLIRRS